MFTIIFLFFEWNLHVSFFTCSSFWAEFAIFGRNLHVPTYLTMACNIPIDSIEIPNV